jgi:hypothetical protein
MTNRDLFSKGFPTNRIPITLPSSGLPVVLRETTVTELKSIAKTIIDNFDRRQMDVIYDAVTEYLQVMLLTDNVDVKEFTEFDRLYCLMVFFQMSFFKDPITYKCPHCGVDINYRYDMSKYLCKMDNAYVEDQVVEIPYKSKIYEFTMGWPTVKTMSKLMHYFYEELGVVTEEMEQTQFGINLVLAFVKKVVVYRGLDATHTPEASVDLEAIDTMQGRLDCLNALPSMVMFDDEDGVFAKVTGYFINRLENCFNTELCPQCHKDTYYGLSQSSLFYSLFYGSLKSLYGFILQVECLLVFRYDCCIFDKEHYMTYNDLSSLVHQLSTTMEKENKERQKVGKDNFTKGLWYIREILNTMIFPEDKKHR